MLQPFIYGRFSKQDRQTFELKSGYRVTERARIERCKHRTRGGNSVLPKRHRNTAIRKPVRHCNSRPPLFTAGSMYRVIRRISACSSALRARRFSYHENFTKDLIRALSRPMKHECSISQTSRGPAPLTNPLCLGRSAVSVTGARCVGQKRTRSCFAQTPFLLLQRPAHHCRALPKSA